MFRQRNEGAGGRRRLSTLSPTVIARYLSSDTALDGESNAYTAVTVGELTPNYRLNIREVWRDRLQFPLLPDAIEHIATRWNMDGLLRGVIIEDKASGTSALQTLRAAAPAWLRDLLISFQPNGDKETRAKQSAVWCANGSVSLPQPSDAVPWLFDFTRELFEFPRGAYADQVDSFAQLIIYLENMLEEGYRVRVGAGRE